MMINDIKYTSSAKDVIKKEKEESKQKQRKMMYEKCTNRVLLQQKLAEKYMKIRHTD